MEPMKRSRAGMTLVEVIAASVLTSLVAGGTLMALTTAVHLAKRSSEGVQVSHLAQQTLEKFRNHVACDDAWFDAACAPTTLPPANTPDLLPDGPVKDHGGTRLYTVAPADCDGVGGVGDCLRMDVTVHWNPPQ